MEVGLEMSQPAENRFNFFLWYFKLFGWHLQHFDNCFGLLSIFRIHLEACGQ
jgi:hypothetical protein